LAYNRAQFRLYRAVGQTPLLQASGAPATAASELQPATSNPDAR
jgi:hypothetical protein